MDGIVKKEIIEAATRALQSSGGIGNAPFLGGAFDSVIELSSSSSSSSSSESSDSDDDDDDGGNGRNGSGSGVVLGRRVRVSNGGGGVAMMTKKKKRRVDELGGVIVPAGFLQQLPPPVTTAVVTTAAEADVPVAQSIAKCSSKQFWKAGDYEGAPCSEWESSTLGMDHVRVHPKFLHSNATSHKWALGAFAELLDNSLDEVCNGATYVNIDMLVSKKDGSRMLLIEDNGGGMDPDKMRQCMSLGYSAKSKLANTIGQYGNGFKTSTMRLGADVIVFSRCCGKDGKSPTQSIGLLSYTFLRSTKKEDIVVPMLDYEGKEQEWNKIIRSSPVDWSKNLETVVQWSPFSSEVDLLRQFNLMRAHGTRIIIYNLWEDDQGQLELDFDADPHDIQIRGVNRDEKNIQMAKEYPNSKHFLTYRHSLRSYTSILYLRLPPSFRIILRGKDVEHHNIVNDMMMSQEVTYRPHPSGDGVPKDTNMIAVVTIGFVKDAKYHIDVQGFNVYHKNRLIKPFWRLWNAAGSDGRGVIGVLEANFVEPAHDKQGFERTTVLARLESRLIQMQKNYWGTNCHRIGYAARRNKKFLASADSETSLDSLPPPSQSKKKNTASSSKTPFSNLEKYSSRLNQRYGRKESENFQEYRDGHLSSKGKNRVNTPTKSGKRHDFSEPSSPSAEIESDNDMHIDLPEKQSNGSGHKAFPGIKSFGKSALHTNRASSMMDDAESQQDCASGGITVRPSMQSHSKVGDVNCSAPSLSDSDLRTVEQLKEENQELRKRFERREGEVLGELLHDLLSERDKCKSLEAQLLVAQQKIDDLTKEQESLIDIFAEERDRRENEELKLKRRLQDANSTIEVLRDKIRQLEKMHSSISKH
ncbi:hypothetical protein RGQ29_004505 [Quercus rubra]|uniref:Morc S5 domain-containing protein n=1 Tax=Quercus rubra TaxID=3512 RepID=A0AAN7EEX5_QUERU|nr:hypothetical protein RGQ29_004505 [Quercus rubra]